MAVTPVTTCECERSVSPLRRMKTWLRNTMTNERLNGLAQMHINDDIELSVDEVIDTFARKILRECNFWTSSKMGTVRSNEKSK